VWDAVWDAVSVSPQDPLPSDAVWVAVSVLPQDVVSAWGPQPFFPVF
jgi:hypothetical protein